MPRFLLVHIFRKHPALSIYEQVLTVVTQSIETAAKVIPAEEKVRLITQIRNSQKLKALLQSRSLD